MRFAVAAEDARRAAIRAALHHGEWLQLLDHLLMILNHLLRELFDFGIFRLLQSDLTQLNFRLVLSQQTIGQEMVDHYIVAASGRLCARDNLFGFD